MAAVISIGGVLSAGARDQMPRSSEFGGFIEAGSADARPSRGQVAVPIHQGSRLLGVLFVNPEDLRDGIAVSREGTAAAASLLQAAVRELQNSGQAGPDAGTPLVFRRWERDCTLFAGDAYLIKGVAGSILWWILSKYHATGKRDFTSKELRLEPTLGLPKLGDNIATRLLTLQRRLRERCPQVSIERVGRGTFRLHVPGPMELREEGI